MNKFCIVFLLVASFLAAGCTTAQQKRQAVASQAAYAISDSLKAGRVDLAQKYSDQLVRLSPPPKKKITIKPIEITRPATAENPGGRVQLTILPPEYQNRETLITGSKEFTALVAEHPDIQKQLQAEEKTVTEFTTKTDATLRAVEAELNKEKKKGIWGWILGLGSSLGIIGVIILCVLFPAAIPIVLNLFTGLIGGINRGLGSIKGWFSRAPPSG